MLNLQLHELTTKCELLEQQYADTPTKDRVDAILKLIQRRHRWTRIFENEKTCTLPIGFISLISRKNTTPIKLEDLTEISTLEFTADTTYGCTNIPLPQPEANTPAITTTIPALTPQPQRQHKKPSAAPPAATHQPPTFVPFSLTMPPSFITNADDHMDYTQTKTPKCQRASPGVVFIDTEKELFRARRKLIPESTDKNDHTATTGTRSKKQTSPTKNTK